MKLKDFRNTNEFKLADCINYVYKDGTEFDGTYRQLEKKEILNSVPSTLNGLKYLTVTIK